MGEYRKKQRIQLSRVTSNNLSAKTNRFIDNRLQYKSLCQLVYSVQKNENQTQNKEINCPINKPVAHNLKTVLQARPWNNEPAKFKTDNGMRGIGVPSSEYLVTASGYTRYAPINKYRAPGEVFLQKDPHSFAYLTQNTDKEIAKHAKNAICSGNTITFILSKDEKTSATRIPQNGLDVWDADVDNNDNVSNRHLGHPVFKLGESLPTLDDTKKAKEEREKQEVIITKQQEGKLPDDKFFKDEYSRLSTTIYKKMLKYELLHRPSEEERKAMRNVALKKAYIEMRKRCKE